MKKIFKQFYYSDFMKYQIEREYPYNLCVAF